MLKLKANTNNYYLYSTSEKGPIVGQFALVDQGKANELRIVAFAIFGQYRGRGYGQQMMQEAIAEANRIRGDRKITLNVEKNNCRALHIYKKYGFKISGNYSKDAFSMMYQMNAQPCLKVKGIEQLEVRPFYDSRWLIRFENGSWCEVTRYDTDNATDIIAEAEKCHCIEEVKTKVNLKSKIYYD